MMEIEARFWELCNAAIRHEEARYRTLCDDKASPDEVDLGARASEQAMIEVIDLVENHPEHRPIFVRCFSELATWKRPAPFMLVPFCMKQLRFPEIPALIAIEAKEHEGTAYYASRMNYWSAIGEAYLDHPQGPRGD